MQKVHDFHKVVIEDIPLIDLRAPVEFRQGAVPTATNLPILDDSQRHEIGICYRERGADAALQLGHRRVSGEVREERINSWLNFLAAHPEALIYCSRGGKRSEIAQQWLSQKSHQVTPRLAGGYKALRNYLLTNLSPSELRTTPVLLGGRTGSGKTRILHRCPHCIDLEALANHRGSTFGRFLSPQPSQVDFENALAWKLIHHRHQGHDWLVLEDEGRYIGSRNIPGPLADFFNGGDLILLEIPLEERLEIIFDEYITGGQQEYCKAYGDEDGLQHWLLAMQRNIDRIKKRLGGERTSRVLQLMNTSQQLQLEKNDSTGHLRWLQVLMCEYYDPMYDYQLEKKNKKAIFTGNREEVTEYLLKMGPSR